MFSLADKIVDRAYRLNSRLGEGGMGAVYRATQLLTGQEVALKLVSSAPYKDGTVDPSNDSHLRLILAREFQTLSSLHHPNVIRVLSYGFDEELGSYFTMDLLHNAETLLAAGMERPLEEKVQLIAGLLRALVYVHQRGILHRDIKPGNVMVIHGEVKLLDFGIASRINNVSGLAGTLDYMAPELLLKEAPSVQSDLYSVGVLFYQMLSGTFPYSRASITKMLSDLLGEKSDYTFSPTVVNLLERFSGAHGDAKADRCSQVDDVRFEHDEKFSRIASDISPAITAILQQLLSRRPEERPTDANAVLKALAAAIKTPLPIETTATRESFLQAIDLVGREAEVHILHGALAQVKAGKSATFLIGGESGIGKSRLLEELRTQALVRGFWVADGQSTTDGNLYYQEFLPLWKALCFRTEITDAEASILKLFLPDIDMLMARVVPDPPAIRPEEMQGRLFNLLLQLLARIRKPLLLVLEDLHWARSETLALLSYLMRHLADLPILIVGTFRSDESPNLPEKFPSAQHIPLLRFSTAEVSRLSQSMLGSVGAEPRLVHYLERQTEGNVFFLVEIMRVLAESAGELKRIGQGELPENVLTVGIERIVDRRIKQVQSVYRNVLDFAATQGRKLDLLVLAQAFPELALRTFLLDCANAAVLESQGNDWRFAHDKLREGVLRHLDDAQRWHLHGRVAETLEQTYLGADRDALSAELAFHFAKGKMPERAFPWYVRAGEKAHQIGLLNLPRTHYRAALELMSELPDLPTLRRQRIDVLLKLTHVSLSFASMDHQLQHVAEAQKLLDSLVSIEDPQGLDLLRQAHIDYLMGRVYYYGNQHPAAIQHFQRVLSIAHQTGDPELLALPNAAIGMAMITKGQMGKAHHMLTHAIAALQRLGNRDERVRCEMMNGLAVVCMGKSPVSFDVLKQALDSTRQSGVEGLFAGALGVTAFAYCFAADWPQALAFAEQQETWTNQTGERNYLVMSWSLQAWCQAYLGKPELAQRLREKALALMDQLGGKLLAADLYAALDGEIALLAGQFEAAQRCAERIFAISKPAGLLNSWGIAPRVLAVVKSRQGANAAEVDAALEESLQVLRSGDNQLMAAQTEVFWGRICRERGDESMAQLHFSRALAQYETSGCEYALAKTRRMITD